LKNTFEQQFNAIVEAQKQSRFEVETLVHQLQGIRGDD
jgi:hypothetical protein